jgi:hypothetical protein
MKRDRDENEDFGLNIWTANWAFIILASVVLWLGIYLIWRAL